jgi:hypothetical protein
LFVIKIAGKVLKVLVEEIVPDRPFEAIAIGRADVGLAFGSSRAWRPDQVEQTLPLNLIEIGLVFLCTVADCRDFLSSSACGFGRGRPWSQH